ncbi:MAG: LysM peptidoglycan-binding domain-containing protein [Chloroflexota bacterium]|nr:LysM peptidoglycan-binding domain-containing protein [Chloroflexota bacterium]
MRGRPAALTTAAGAMALVLIGGPIIASPARAGEPTVVVLPGDTLGAIAARYRTSVERLAALNRLSDPNLIHAGQHLLIPQVSAPAVAPPAVPRTHVVRFGEHLTGIAATYGTTIAAIVAANGLSSPDLIFPGQRLLIPGTTTAGSQVPPAPGGTAPASTELTSYVVRAGETLTAIAGRYHTTLAALTTLNHLVDPSRIQAGQVLLVPTPVRVTADWSTRRFDAATRGLMAVRDDVRDLVTRQARRLGVPVPLALAVAWQESGWRQDVVSDAGAIGIMQLLPDTADWVATSMLGAPIDIGSSDQNVRGGVTLLKHYLVRYQGNKTLALGAYYQGQRAVDEQGIFPISRPYIASILALEALLAP